MRICVCYQTFGMTIYVILIPSRRPYGVEPEYFVQLFVDYDESLKLPTVGDLMKKMFWEQDITFTEV